jgi:SAM-dependent methyltransferase
VPKAKRTVLAARHPQRWIHDSQCWLYERFTDRALSLVGELPVTSVLEFGCGDGYMAAKIAEGFPERRVTGVDFASDELQSNWTRLSAPNLQFREADSPYSLPFGSHTHEMVTAFGVLEHLDDPGKALDEICRVCHGWLIATVPWEPACRVSNVARGLHLSRFGRPPGHLHCWTMRGFRRFLALYGEVGPVRRSSMWTLARVRLGQ